ncbi:unnamed protein product [Trichogramma brassicae]|uniref:RNA-directed DNA polymerase n=1 Tax=Trichogramma brassicae TaxID=86971 RepID=A0A6H5I6G6_9HYME|nr:unnamed protein product [Trichogramma brassicae]
MAVSANNVKMRTRAQAEQFKQRMEALVRLEGPNELLRKIKDLPMQSVIEKLQQRRLSTIGDEETLRVRLLRARCKALPNSNQLDVPWDPEIDEETEKSEKSLNETTLQVKNHEMEIDGAQGGSAPPVPTDGVFDPQMIAALMETIRREVGIAVAREIAKLSRGGASADAVGASVELGLRGSSPRDGNQTPKIKKSPRKVLRKMTTMEDLATEEMRRSSTPWDPKTPLGLPSGKLGVKEMPSDESESDSEQEHSSWHDRQVPGGWSRKGPVIFPPPDYARAEQQWKWARMLRDTGLTFSGAKDKLGAETFLARLERYRTKGAIPQQDMLFAVDALLVGESQVWYESVEHILHSWQDFERRIRRSFASQATPEEFLTELRRRTQGKDAPFVWGVDQEQAFETLKQSLSEAPVLVRPDFEKEFAIQTDASDYAIGAVLTQEREDDGMLYKRSNNALLDPVSIAENSWRLVVPAEQRERVLAESPCLTSSGHLGAKKTYDRLACEYWWPGMCTPTHQTPNPTAPNRQQIDLTCKTQQLLRGYDLKFGKSQDDDAETFISRLRTVTQLTNVSERDLLAFMPSMLAGDAEIWAEPLYTTWTTLEKFEEDLRLQYGIPNFQIRLENEILTRTQGPDETIAVYIAKIRLLMNKLSPAWTLEKQLDRIYENLHPKYIKSINRNQFTSIKELTLLGQQQERVFDKQKTYKPPPPADHHMIRKSAYCTTKTHKTAAISEVEEVAAVNTYKPRQTNTPPSNTNNNTATNNTQRQPKTQIGSNNKKTDHCWICDATDHWAMKCPQKTGDICFRCRTEVVITDHASLKWLHNLRDPSGRLARWATALQAYNMDISHRKGAFHKVPDYLSRSIDEIAAIKTKDPIEDLWYAKLLREVELKPDKFPDYRIDNNLLYIHRPKSLKDPLLPELNSWKLVVPAENRKTVLHDMHNTPQAGHLGREKTFEKLALLYFWPKMRSNVYNYVRRCKKCQLHKPSQQQPKGLMGKRDIEGPWTHVASDVMGPLPRSKAGNSYIVVFQDLFTKYIEVKPMRKANASTILHNFEEQVLFRWGCPKYLITDNGTEYSNRAISKRMLELGIHQTTIAAYRPQANPTERVNRTFKTMISMFIDQDHSTWDVYVKELTFAFNNAFGTSTGFSAYLNFGRNPRTIVTIRNELENTPFSLESLTPDMWADRMSRLPAIYDFVRKNLAAANEKQAKYYNANRKEISFEINDLVVRKNHTLSSKVEKLVPSAAPAAVLQAAPAAARPADEPVAVPPIVPADEPVAVPPMVLAFEPVAVPPAAPAEEPAAERPPEAAELARRLNLERALARQQEIVQREHQDLICFRCQERGHVQRYCTSDSPGRYCYKCSAPGYDTMSCPYCAKYQKRAVENMPEDTLPSLLELDFSHLTLVEDEEGRKKLVMERNNDVSVRLPEQPEGLHRQSSCPWTSEWRRRAQRETPARRHEPAKKRTRWTGRSPFSSSGTAGSGWRSSNGRTQTEEEMPASADVSTELARTSVLHRRVRDVARTEEENLCWKRRRGRCWNSWWRLVSRWRSATARRSRRGGRGDGYASSRRRSDGGKRTGATATFGIRTRTSALPVPPAVQRVSYVAGPHGLVFQPFVEQQQRRSQAGSPLEGQQQCQLRRQNGYQEEQQQQHRQLPRLQPQQHQQEEAYVEVRPLSPVAGPSSLSGNAAAPARIRGENFGGLQLVRFVLGLGPPRGAFFECHQPGHTRRQCRNPFDGVLCTNCGRRGVKVQQCPRCSRGWKKSQRNFHSKKAAAKKQLWKALGGERR